MPYGEQDWIDRIKSRSDLSTQVTHLTKPGVIDGREIDALDVLIKILRERKIIGSNTASGFIVGTIPAVCFMEAPPYSLCENIDFEYELSKKHDRKPKYHGFGLMLPKTYVYRRGGRPVIYEETETAKQFLPATQWWRIVRFDLSDSDNMVDWTHEREWRIPNNFAFDIDQASVLVPNPPMFREFVKRSKQRGEDVSELVRCVIPLGSLLL
jgi:hypothetical protein